MKLGFCHKDVLKTRNYRDLMYFCMYITLRYFPFYDDKYGCVRFDDDGDHVEHKTQGFFDLRTLLQTDKEVLHIQYSSDLRPPLGCFNDRSLEHHCMCLHFYGPYSWITY